MIGKYGYDAITVLAALGLWAALVLASILFVLVTGPIIVKIICFIRGVLPMDHAKAVAYRIILGGCLLCWAVVGAIIVVFTLK